MIRISLRRQVHLAGLITAAWLFITAVAAWGATPLGTAFTYQGELKRSGSPVNDTCDCQFSLWDAPDAGAQVGPTLTFDGQGGNPAPIVVADGLLTVELDFGAGAFNGDGRWLQIDVACPSGGILQQLSPRQALTATPYALQTRGIFADDGGNIGIGTDAPAQQLSVAAGTVIDQEGLQDGTIRSRALSFGGSTSQEAITSKRTPGGNQFGLDFYTQSFALPPRMSITNAGSVGIGTSAPRAPLHVALNTGEGLPESLVAGTVLLAQTNNSGNWAHMSIISGRTGRAQLNFGSADNDRQGAISYDNNADVMDIQVNAATRMRISASGNVGIGTDIPRQQLSIGNNLDLYSGSAKNPTRPSIRASDVDNLILNASGDGAVWINNDGGAGGVFVRSSGETIMRITGAGQVGISKDPPSHPLHVGTTFTNGNGAHVTAGGVWTNGSDRDSKQDFEPIDRREILKKVSELPITRWRYKGQAASVHHIGPVAQDFHAAFGLGESDTHIGTIDADGVALAAIQGLYEIVQEKDAEIESLRAEKHAEVTKLKERLAKLETVLLGTGKGK